jgi:serine/threonine protein kinase
MGVSVDLKNSKQKANPVFHRGTPRYMAPEQNESKSVQDPYKVEVFSLGIILFRMIFKAFPFSSDPKTAESELKKPSFLQDFVKSSKNTSKVVPSSELLDLLQNMLTHSNSKRYTL